MAYCWAELLLVRNEIVLEARLEEKPQKGAVEYTDCTSTEG